MFSLLMSVYDRESPEHLSEALESVLQQTIIPAQVIIVKDGPLHPSLNNVIDLFQGRLNAEIVQLPFNVGLASALNKGLEIVREPWVMRFDSDDVCCPKRFEEQMAWMVSNRYDIFGSQIDEFYVSPSQPWSKRTVPADHSEIIRFAKRRNPFNHMTVCFRTDFVKMLGGYPALHCMEDYALWINSIAAGARLGNSKSTLVHARVGNGMFSRRGGFKYIRSEFNLQRRMVDILKKSPLDAVLHFVARSFVFAIPRYLRAKVYKFYLRDELADMRQ